MVVLIMDSALYYCIGKSGWHFFFNQKIDLFIFIYLTCMSVLTECVVCTTCLHGAPRAQKRGLDSLELMLLVVVTTM